jgi:plasmid stabilization system protein ParE
MIFSFHPEADKEFREAIEYYETCQRSLGEDFYIEVHSTIDRIAGFPQTWPVLEGDIRRCLVHRFPYGVLYSVEPEGVFLLAVMHLRRDPDYWKHRR